jgi:hypothetical protein
LWVEVKLAAPSICKRIRFICCDFSCRFISKTCIYFARFALQIWGNEKITIN